MTLIEMVQKWIEQPGIYAAKNDLCNCVIVMHTTTEEYTIELGLCPDCQQTGNPEMEQMIDILQSVRLRTQTRENRN